jgi:hypothetical protein
LNAIFSIGSGATYTQNSGLRVSVNISTKFSSSGNVNIVSGDLNLTKTANFTGGGGVQNTIANDGRIVINGTSTSIFTNTTFTGTGNGTLRLDGGGELDLVCTNQVNALMSQTAMNSIAGNGQLIFGGISGSFHGTFSGAGSLTVQINSQAYLGCTMVNGWELTNNGIISLDNNLRISGGSNITNNSGASFDLTSNNISYIGADGSLGTFTNSGTLKKSAGAGNSTVDPTLTNSGNLEVDAGTMVFSQPVTQAGGQTYLAGGNLQIGGAGFTVNGGTIKGGGTITAALVSNGGAIDQSGLGGFLTLTIQGAYTQQANGQLSLKIGSAGGMVQSDRLVITGQANLNGSLTVQAAGGYVPAVGDSASIISYNSRNGDFNAANITLPPGMRTDPQANQYFIRR